MFWRFGGYANISTIDTILDKPDFTLEELLDESDLIQELKQHNTKLIEYLREDKVLKKLLDYVVAPKLEAIATPDDAADDESKAKNRLLPFSRPGASRLSDSEPNDDDEQEKKRNRYAFVACEVLSSDTWSIYEALTENRDLVRNFWAFLSLPAPLDPLQASYFTKVNESLFEKKTDDMMKLLRSLPDAVPNLLRHVECPMIMDLLLKIIALDRSEGGQGIVEVRNCARFYVTPWLTLSMKSGFTPRTSSRPCYLASAPITVGSCKRRLESLSRQSSPSLPTPRRTSNSASVLMSLLANSSQNLALNSSLATCLAVATL
jgi:hypothetical protein